MNLNNIKNQKISLKTTVASLFVLLAIILISSLLYYKKVVSDYSASNMTMTPIIAKVQDGVAEVNYFATTSNAQILARYPKGDKIAADYIYSEIGKFLGEIGENTSGSSAVNQFIAPFSTSTSSNTRTIIFKIYKYSGGAHGNLYSKAIIYDKNNSVVEVKDLLAKYDMKKVVTLVGEDLKKAYYEMVKGDTKLDLKSYFKSEEGVGALRWISEGSIATSTNYSVAWEDGDSLKVYISQYQAWPYAYGDYTVSIPTSQIRK